jgi:hypothetical protein
MQVEYEGNISAPQIGDDTLAHYWQLKDGEHIAGMGISGASHCGIAPPRA